MTDDDFFDLDSIRGLRTQLDINECAKNTNCAIAPLGQSVNI